MSRLMKWMNWKISKYIEIWASIIGSGGGERETVGMMKMEFIPLLSLIKAIL